MKSLMIFLLLFFCFQAEARPCDCLNKIHYLCIMAEADLDQAYYRDAKDVTYYHGRFDAMNIAYFQVGRIEGECRCLDIVKELYDRAEDQLYYVASSHYWAGDVNYYLGQRNAYEDLVLSLSTINID